jgi:hypothetical protein
MVLALTREFDRLGFLVSCLLTDPLSAGCEPAIFSAVRAHSPSGALPQAAGGFIPSFESRHRSKSDMEITKNA